MSKELTPTSIYIHWPFCLSKCPYCDFNSHVADFVDQSRWMKAFRKSIYEYKHKLESRSIRTVYFGGGTPSLMSPDLVDDILNTLSDISQFEKDAEITLEANPTSSEAEKFQNFRKAGVNRISIGIQALRNEALSFLGRRHGADEAAEVVKLAKEIFPRYSFDLMYARGNQKLETWQQELSEAMEMAANHISLYQLMIEKGTQFYKDYKTGRLTAPSSENKAELYDYTNKYLQSKGLNRYEISNYARPGEESKHNLAYWRYSEYLGIGPGAHSRLFESNGGNSPSEAGEGLNVTAQVMHHQPEKWLESVENANQLQQNTSLNSMQLVEELLIMNLRIPEGIDKNYFYKLTGKNFDELFSSKLINALVENDFAENTNNQFALTEYGMGLHQQIIQKLYSEL